MTELLGDGFPLARGKSARPEAAALAEVIKLLRAHPKVAWCERMNSGAASMSGFNRISLDNEVLHGPR